VVFPVLAQAFAQNWWGLMICRLFMGLGETFVSPLLLLDLLLNGFRNGIKISTIPIFCAEVSPANIRSGMVTSFQL
jgi:hypothetical protein